MLAPGRIRVEIPTLHIDQIKAWELEGRFKAIRCGRRWGKTAYGVTEACDAAVHAKYVGWFAPDYKRIAETYRDIEHILGPVKQSASRDGVFRTINDGRIDFWTLADPYAGRSRKYHLVIVDEAAFTGDEMLDTWRKAIRPTLLDYRGKALVLSNTNGIDETNFFWQICNQPQHGFVQYHAPTHNNPYLPKDEIDKLQSENHPLVYQQEYLAEFVDWSGVAFFSKDKLLVNGEPVDFPPVCDTVFAVVDTATKTGRENDGTAVIYFALIGPYGPGYNLVVLDWEILQIEGDLLETWLPTIFQNLKALTGEMKCRMGSVGAHIEDKSSGMVLLQAARRRNWPAHAIDSKLTSVGKDERAISVSGYVYQGLVKLSRRAYDKATQYKETTRNHLMAQVLSFRVGNKDASPEDDLLDCFCYGIAIALGNSEGF